MILDDIKNFIEQKALVSQNIEIKYDYDTAKGGDTLLLTLYDNVPCDLAMRSGINRSDVANAIQAANEGMTVGVLNEQERMVMLNLQVRNADGSACIEIAGSTINITCSTLTINGQTTIQGGTTIDGVSFLGHTHSGVETGGGNTGGVNA